MAAGMKTAPRLMSTRSSVSSSTSPRRRPTEPTNSGMSASCSGNQEREPLELVQVERDPLRADATGSGRSSSDEVEPLAAAACVREAALQPLELLLRRVRMLGGTGDDRVLDLDQRQLR